MDIAPTLAFAGGWRAAQTDVDPVRAGARPHRRPGSRRGIAEFAAGLGNVERVEVLPFHQLGRFKWQALGLNYSLEHTTAPSPELIRSTLGVFRERG